MPDKPSGIAPLRGWFSRTFLAEPVEETIYPPVEQPYSWDPQPFVTGDEQLANEAWNLLNLYPEARANISKINQGLTRRSMDMGFELNQFFKQKHRIDEFPVGYRGVYSIPERGGDASIGIAPGLKPYTRSFTLGHEVGHARAKDPFDQKIADEFGKNWQKYWWGK